MLTLDKFMNTVDGLEEARILLAGVEIGIFNVLADKKLTAKQISNSTKANFDGISNLLNALAAMGAINYKVGKYSNAPDMYKYFCEKSPYYKKGTVHLMRENNDEWSYLIKTIKKGRNPKEYEGGDNPKFRKLFTYAMHERSIKYADKIAIIVTEKPVGRLLDLGAGPASYSAAILKKDKKATAVAFDRSSALKVAKELIGDGKLAKRFSFKSGDLFDTPYGDKYDTVFFSNILHIYSIKENKTLLKKICKSMVKGGRIILVDLFLKDNRIEPYDAAMFSLTMLLFTATGKTYTFSESEKLLSQCGFSKFERSIITHGTSIIQAVKK
jgi:ubiquinone/menaquinone biosynthesis C-methylase UbiE